MQPVSPLPDDAARDSAGAPDPSEQKPDHLAESTAQRMKAAVNWQVTTEHFSWAARQEIHAYAAEVALLRKALAEAEHARRTNLTRACLLYHTARALIDAINRYGQDQRFTSMGGEFFRSVQELDELLAACEPYLK